MNYKIRNFFFQKAILKLNAFIFKMLTCDIDIIHIFLFHSFFHNYLMNKIIISIFYPILLYKLNVQSLKFWSLIQIYPYALTINSICNNFQIILKVFIILWELIKVMTSICFPRLDTQISTRVFKTCTIWGYISLQNLTILKA